MKCNFIVTSITQFIEITDLNVLDFLINSYYIEHLKPQNFILFSQIPSLYRMCKF